MQSKAKEERQEIYNEVRQLDKRVDQDQPRCLRIRDKELRAGHMETILAFKRQVAAVFNVMAEDSYDKIDNLLLA